MRMIECFVSRFDDLHDDACQRQLQPQRHALPLFSSYLKVDILDPVLSVYRGYYLNLALRLTMYRYSI
ncbi:hypothetical protein AB7M22_002309 [Pseudomonas sp. ADAK2 TE3594]